MKLISTSKVIKIILKRLFPNLDEVKRALAETAESAVFVTFQVKEMEPGIEEVKRQIAILESDIDDVKKSFQRFEDRQKLKTF